MKLILAAAALVGLIGSASAESKADSERYIALSAGAQSCGTFVKADASHRSQFIAFALGFISGVNSVSHGEYMTAGQDWDEDAYTLWLDNYCTTHPLDAFAGAASALRMAVLKKMKLNP